MTKNPATRRPGALGAEVWGSESGILGVGHVSIICRLLYAYINIFAHIYIYICTQEYMVIQAYKISLFKTMSIGCIAGIDANISSIPSVFILYCMVPFGHFSLMLALKETHPRKCGCSRNHHFITVLPLYIFRTRPPKIIQIAPKIFFFKPIGFHRGKNALIPFWRIQF